MIKHPSTYDLRAIRNDTGLDFRAARKLWYAREISDQLDVDGDLIETRALLKLVIEELL